MVKTRNTMKREQEEKQATEIDQVQPSTSGAQNVEQKGEIDKTMVLDPMKSGAGAGSYKPEMPRAGAPSMRKSLSNKSSRTSTSSIEARKKKLELEAAEAKARIAMELIDKRLEADLAELNEEYSPHQSVRSVRSADKQRYVEKWVQDSENELEVQHIANKEGTSGLLCPPATTEAGTDGPIQQLATVLKDLVTTSVSNQNNNINLLSRISTSKELPLFAGDSMEWLQFKMAYEESTRLCKFSDSENLWRLRRCLRGAAKDAVQALLITATSPKILMSTLELQFGNPDGILSRIKQDINKLNAVSSEYHKDIVVFSNKIKNYVAAVSALGRENHLEDSSLITVVLSKLPTILLSKWADYRYLHNTAGTTTRLDQLSEFLHEEAVKISQCSVTLINLPKDMYKRKYIDNSANNQSQTILVQSGQSFSKCRYCHGPIHNLTDCKKFKRSLRKDRWRHVKKYGLCYKCLLCHHDKQLCPAPVCDVANCGQAHHRLLHFVPSEKQHENNNVNNSTVQVTEIESDSSSQSQVVANTNSSAKVLLKVVPINIHGPNGVINTSCLLDDGSTVTLISADLAERAGLRGRRGSMRVCGAWDNTELVCDTHLVDLTLSNKEGHMFTISARSVNELNLPKQNTNIVNCDNYTHLQGLKSDLCYGQSKPQILIGQDNYHLLFPLEVVVGTPNEPCATRTPLGWCLHGRAPPASMTSSAHESHSTLFISSNSNDVSDDVADQNQLLRNLHEEVRRSFTFDSLGVSSKPRENHEDVRAVEHLDRNSTLTDGRWYVGLPWKNENCVMPDSFPHALSRLKAVERKMEKCDSYRDRYNERVQHLFENDYARELQKTEVTSKTWYLPHFGVDNKNKKRLRLVFDAAAKTNGLSLNDYLLKGPDLLTSLFGIMLRFREQRVGVTSDIKDMYLRVKIKEEDQNALRFLYRSDPKAPLKTYVMSSLIFGANCSPFIAQYIKNKNAQRFESTMLPACQAIYNQHYVDDYIDSVPDEETTIKLIRDIQLIHQQGGFELRNWTSNSKEVLQSMPKETLGEAAVKFKIGEQYESERTLGLIWFPCEDALSFDVSFKQISESLINGTQRPTKRDMLRIVMSIFDVYGFLSPFTINGKIILQECWQLDIDWDDKIPDIINNKWSNWISCLNSLRNIRLPRYYYNAAAIGVPTTGSNSASAAARQPPELDDAPAPIRTITSQLPNVARYTNLQLHIFCDASSKAMCAVAYWRWEDSGNVNKAFVASKCRVAPNKTTSIPRLELNAAILAARLATTIIKEHKIKAERQVFWSDSSTVLFWLRNKSRTYKPYIANRLGEIDELTCSDEWRYIPTHLNIADVGTREAYDVSILQGQWLHGPDFLSHDECTWPKDVTRPAINETDLERVNLVQSTCDNGLPVPEPARFSSWLRLLRSTRVVLMFINKCRKLFVDVTDDTMDNAERLLLRYSQAQCFKDEINILKKGKSIEKYSKLLTLSPYLDEHGVLRVGGRIDDAPDVSPETKRPAILDGRDHITRLLVNSYHISAAHGNQETVVNNLKQKYWIIKLRPTVKYIQSRCMICKIRKCKPEIPRMGNLPEARMAHHQRVFTFCGIDLFGPQDVTIGRRRERRYGVLFTCLTVRAIHIETVGSLTTDALINALRRMGARRGWPKHIYSDNGTNLRGADTELRRALHDLARNSLQDAVTTYKAKWTFIPAASPHWGGAWERLIRSVKEALKVVLKERAPREETFNTLLAEVENIVNSRPLTHVSVEAGSKETLTPNHFLLGSSSNLPQMGVFDDSDFYVRKQWRIAQRLADLYWQRWVREVLPDLLPRKKWHKEQRPLQVGDLVFVVDPDGPRNHWPRGIIEETLPGKDGRTRMVKIRTRTGVLTRSAGRVARLPVEDECCQDSTGVGYVSDATKRC